MSRNRAGSGSVFQRTYRDANGKLRKTKNWYIEFVNGNRTIREATQFTRRFDAADFLKQRVADAMAGKIPLAKGVTYDDLAELIVNDYRNNGRRSMESLEKTRLARPKCRSNRFPHWSLNWLQSRPHCRPFRACLPRVC